jgi:uncharacterized protein YkwD
MFLNMRAAMFFPILFSLLMACSKADVDEPVKDIPPSSVNKTVLLQLVNDVRKNGCECGDSWYPPVPAITWNDQLEAAAYHHSKDMSEKKYFSHDAPDGGDPGERIRNEGYQWSTYGENIGQGYGSEQSVMNGWLSSPGHCRNIMGKSYREMGVARVGSYWTQVFASK